MIHTYAFGQLGYECLLPKYKTGLGALRKGKLAVKPSGVGQNTEQGCKTHFFLDLTFKTHPGTLLHLRASFPGLREDRADDTL